MYAPTDNNTTTTTSSRSEQAAGRTHPPAGNLIAMWARVRRQVTPWAYPHLRALAAMRFGIGLFLVGVGAMLVASGHAELAAVPLAGAALHFSLASLDFAVVRSAAYGPESAPLASA
jgi:hypothetical protein